MTLTMVASFSPTAEGNKRKWAALVEFFFPRQQEFDRALTGSSWLPMGWFGFFVVVSSSFYLFRYGFSLVKRTQCTIHLRPKK